MKAEADWRKLDIAQFAAKSRAETPAMTEGALQTGEVAQRTRLEALRQANNKKYGPESTFINHRLRVHPIMSPRFSESLDVVDLKPGATIVDMGVNDGYEIQAFATWGGSDFLDRVTIWGIDISDAAITKARQDYPGRNFHFLHGSGELLEGTDAEGGLIRIPDNSADLYISVNSFQSTGLDKTVACTSAVRVLKAEGRMVLVIPPFHDPGTGDENYPAKLAAVVEISALLHDKGFAVKTLGAQERYTFLVGLRGR